MLVDKPIIQLSRDKGFISRDNLIKVNEEYYYLWLCELQKWFRDEHNIYVQIFRNEDGYNKYTWRIDHPLRTHNKWRDTYEESLEDGLFETLKLIKNTLTEEY